MLIQNSHVICTHSDSWVPSHSPKQRAKQKAQRPQTQISTHSLLLWVFSPWRLVSTPATADGLHRWCMPRKSLQWIMSIVEIWASSSYWHPKFTSLLCTVQISYLRGVYIKKRLWKRILSGQFQHGNIDSREASVLASASTDDEENHSTFKTTMLELQHPFS